MEKPRSLLPIIGTYIKLEIGGSWLGKSFQNSVINVEAKLLLLTEAFENLNCLRVEFKTDSLNVKSQKASKL